MFEVLNKKLQKLHRVSFKLNDEGIAVSTLGSFIVTLRKKDENSNLVCAAKFGHIEDIEKENLILALKAILSLNQPKFLKSNAKLCIDEKLTLWFCLSFSNEDIESETFTENIEQFLDDCLNMKTAFDEIIKECFSKESDAQIKNISVKNESEDALLSNMMSTSAIWG